MKTKIILLLLIFSLALFLRLYKITDIPNGFNQDESAIGYNAYSILQTGKDEYGKEFPLYFKSFGDHKLPAYIYITAVSEKIFGLNEFAVRLPSALLGSLTIVMIVLLLRTLAISSTVALVAGFLLAINPWHLFFSRAAFEDNIALAFAVFGVWMFMQAIRSKKYFYFFLSVIGFALSLYSYNVTRLLAPALLLGLIWFNRESLKHFSKKILLSIGCFLIVLLLPFIITFFSPAGAMSASGALITSTDIQAKSIEMRSYMVSSAGIIGTLFFNKYIFTVWQYLQNLVNVFSVNFFFISGSNHGSQGIGNMGTFYLLEFVSILLGILFIIKNKLKQFYFFIFWTLISVFVLALSKEVPHATRGYFLTIPLEVFSALGFLAIAKSIKHIKLIKIRYLLFIGVSLLCIYNLVYYFSSYYSRFPLLYASSWREQDSTVAKFIQLNQDKYDTIIFDNSAGYIYTSLLFFTAYPPEEFQKTSKRAPDDTEGFSSVMSFGKYQWKDIEWEKDINLPNALIITSPDKVPPGTPTVDSFAYPETPIVLSIKERISQYPNLKIAYVAVETK